MAEILGLGLTHFPPLAGRDEDMARILQRALYPDIPADRALYEALAAADYRTWRGTALSAMEESGQQEMLNWMCLAGAMAELGRKPTETAWIETHIFNSNKCFAYFLP